MDWSEKYNKLPDETRLICAAIDAQRRIQHLNAEKERLRSRYRQNVKEINEWIKNCERHIVDLERETNE